MRIFKCSFAKFSRGSMPPDPLKRGCAFGTPTNAICDVTTFISAILSPPPPTGLCWYRHCNRAVISKQNSLWDKKRVP